MTARYTEREPIPAERPTLVEGLPGLGLVASIAVDQIRTQLNLTHCGSIDADEFPQVTTFEDGLVRDLVRVYAGGDPPVMTLQSDLALPVSSYPALGDGLFEHLPATLGRVVFLAGIAAEREGNRGEVYGVATTPDLRDDLTDAGIELASDVGLVGGTTGALAKYCYHRDVPAVVLLVKSHPYLPDLTAARAVIESGIEPLVDFDIDTTELEEQAEAIRRQKQQIAHQMQAMREEEERQTRPGPSMYY